MSTCITCNTSVDKKKRGTCYECGDVTCFDCSVFNDKIEDQKIIVLCKTCSDYDEIILDTPPESSEEQEGDCMCCGRETNSFNMRWCSVCNTELCSECDKLEGCNCKQ